MPCQSIPNGLLQTIWLFDFYRSAFFSLRINAFCNWSSAFRTNLVFFFSSSFIYSFFCTKIVCLLFVFISCEAPLPIRTDCSFICLLVRSLVIQSSIVHQSVPSFIHSIGRSHSLIHISIHHSFLIIRVLLIFICSSVFRLFIFRFVIVFCSKKETTLEHFSL